MMRRKSGTTGLGLLIVLFAVMTLPSWAQSTMLQDANLARSESAGTRYQASSFVPLDSWIYPALDRLIALGYIETASSGMRPWTRLECARLVAEAQVNAEGEGSEDVADGLLEALDREFAGENRVLDGGRNRNAEVESVYSRVTFISGTPLRDSFHFGQTLVNDYGRPYGKGANEVSGAVVRGSYGPFALYVRGEYQYASALPAYNMNAQQQIAAFDSSLVQGGTLPYNWDLRQGITSRPRTIEAYVTANMANWQISFGQQSLWWGPARSTSLILSNNAEAMPMLRFNRVKPAKLPSFLSVLGPFYFDLFFAREGGVHYVGLGPSFQLYGSATQPLKQPPYLWGVALAIKPTPNLELGFTHTVIFAGYGRPLNLRTFLHTFSILGNGQEVDPGKRVTQFNFTYHLPGLRDKVLLYTEGMAWDDPHEGKFVARWAFDPGVYLPRVPGVKKMDLRMEGVYTDLPKLTYTGYYYSNSHYIEGYTNYGQILGSWVGRQGRGGQVSTTYWLTPRNTITASYRKMTADKAVLQGGNMDELTGSWNWQLRPTVEITASGQYEHWKFPLLNQNAQQDFTTMLSVQFHPNRPIRRP